MNNVKTNFSIKDLENLSGIKAHTIRIWEKRYNILAPMRTDSNIRYYDIASLQKLLNVKLLHDHGYKISNISKLDDSKLPELVNDIVSKKNAGSHAVNAFILSMMNFDEPLFFNTWKRLLSEKSFGEVFYEVIIPLMDEIGMLWQTNTINPAHEHFISYLVRQRILASIEAEQIKPPVKDDNVFVLYLPMGEIHEIGLMYLHYQIIRSGYKAIFLGGNIPMESLVDLGKHFENITFVSYFTVAPHRDEVGDYLKRINHTVLKGRSKLWLSGRNASLIDENHLPENIRIFHSIENVVSEL